MRCSFSHHTVSPIARQSVCESGIKRGNYSMMIPRRVLRALLLFTSASSQVLAFSRLTTTPAFGTRSSPPKGLTTLASTSSSSPEFHNDPRLHVEFTNLEPLPENDLRRERLARDSALRSRFVHFGDELWDLRSQMDQLSARLVKSMQEGSEEIEEVTRDKLRQAEQKDPELVYMLELSDCHEALSEGRVDDAALHQERAQAARAVLPQFNLDGLWVGKYGNHGYELINVTYVGDTLIGVKVTGDRNVPRGEISFQVDLNPLRKHKVPSAYSSRDQQSLQPIQLTEQAARKWGTSQLPRYAGLGQVAEEGFVNNQWMDGQLIIIGEEYFSFAWLPIEQQIFFGRPSPELALKMLRDSGMAPFRTTTTVFDQPPSLEDDLNLQKDFVTRCLEKTHEFEDDVTGGLLDEDPMGCIWHPDDSDECYFQ